MENIYNMKPKHIYNLFSNFGNIEFILLKRIQKTILIQFEDQKYAYIAKNNLNNLFFFGNVMRIIYSTYDRIKLSKKKGPENSYEFQIFNQKARRFDCPREISVNYPSMTLHLSNLEPCLTVSQVKSEVSKYGQVDKI